MKYKLINTTTKEEHLCDKFTIDGFDYYVSDKGYFKHNDLNVPSDFSKVSDISITKIHDLDIVNDSRNGYKKVIATNNPNIDIPKVVDMVETLAKRHSDELSNDDDAIIFGFMEGYNKSQETHPFSEENMIEFAEWCDNSEEAARFWRTNRVIPTMDNSHLIKVKEKRKELFQLWKEQRPKTVYYE